MLMTGTPSWSSPLRKANPALAANQKLIPFSQVFRLEALIEWPIPLVQEDN